MSFADNLMELRKLNNLSQEDIAEKIGVSRQTLSKYETGESLQHTVALSFLPYAAGKQLLQRKA